MYPVTGNFHTLATQDSPKTRCRIYFIDNTVDCTDDNDVQTNGTLLKWAAGDTDSNGRIGQNGVVFNELFNPDKNIQIGRAVSSQIGMTLLNTDGALDNFQYGRCKVYLDVYDAANTTWLACPMGVYIIELPTKRKVQLINAVGFDQMTKLDAICDTWWQGLNWSGGLTLLQIVNSMATQLGVSVSSNTASAIVNSSLTFTAAPFDCVEVTYREVLEVIAEATGTVARFDRNGALDLRYFELPTISGMAISIDTDTVGNKCLALNVAEYNVSQIDLLRAKFAEGDIGVTVGSGTNEYVITNNLFLNGANTATITNKLTPIYNRLYYFIAQYTPVSGRFIWDWSIEAGDMVDIVNDGTIHTVPIFQQTMTWRGGYVVSDLVCDGDKTRPVLDSATRDYYRLDSDMRTLVIEAPRINLLGYTTINNGFKVNLDGTFEANGATISGNITSQNPNPASPYKTVILNGLIRLFDEDGVQRCYLVAEQGGAQFELTGDSGRQFIDSDLGFVSYDENNTIRARISEDGIVVRDSSDAKVFEVADSYITVNRVLQNDNGPVEIQHVKTNTIKVDYGATISGDLTVGGVLDVTPRRCYATLSSPGWYRVLTVTDQGRAERSWMAELCITRSFSYADNEVHSVKLMAVFNSFAFTGENSKTNTLGVDKIRYTRNGSTGYVDIHYSLSNGNVVAVDFNIHVRQDTQANFTAESLQSVADAPSGETVLTEYTFSANGTGDLNVNGTVAGQGFADLLFGVGNSISSNTNCDSLTSEGKYTCGSAAIAGTLTNPPYTEAFGMLVVRVAEAQRLVQVAMPNNTTITIKLRYYNGTSWTAWKTLTPS
jgi:hypothetical protein